MNKKLITLSVTRDELLDLYFSVWNSRHQEDNYKKRRKLRRLEAKLAHSYYYPING
jgi:hypothetical protein